MEAAAQDQLRELLAIPGKQERETKLDELKATLKDELAGEPGDKGMDATAKRFHGRDKEISAAYRAVQKKLVRERILRDKVRIDGRGLADIRALGAEVEVLPRVHGSAIFERGETQIMGVCLLYTSRCV